MGKRHFSGVIQAAIVRQMSGHGISWHITIKIGRNEMTKTIATKVLIPSGALGLGCDYNAAFLLCATDCSIQKPTHSSFVTVILVKVSINAVGGHTK